MLIGIPKEIKADEYRVGLTPATARMLGKVVVDAPLVLASASICHNVLAEIWLCVQDLPEFALAAQRIPFAINGLQ